MTGFGLGWVNVAADYSRYLPRTASSRGVVGWTTFGASVAPVVLLVFGLLLAGSSTELSDAIAKDPIGALAAMLPTWFQGFLYTLGVPVAAWAGIMLADIAMRHRDYAEAELYDPSGRYGDVRWTAVGLLLLGTVLGWGLVTNTTTEALMWQGYLLGPFGLGGRDGAWAYANLGVLVALVIGFVGTLILDRSRVRAQEA